MKKWLVRAGCDKGDPLAYIVEAEAPEGAVTRVAALLGRQPVELPKGRTFLCEPGQTPDDLRDELDHNFGSPRRTPEVILVAEARLDENLEHSDLWHFPARVRGKGVGEPTPTPKPKGRRVRCHYCHKLVPQRTAHLIHPPEFEDGGEAWVGDECCWDERLRD